VELNTWKGVENLGNAKEVVKEYKREYQRDKKDIRR